MHKRDYEAIARTFLSQLQTTAACRGIVPDDVLDGQEQATRSLAREQARVFKADNPRFDEDTFIQACGMQPFTVPA